MTEIGLVCELYRCFVPIAEVSFLFFFNFLKVEMAHFGRGAPSSHDRPSSYSSGSRGRGAIPRRSEYRGVSLFNCLNFSQKQMLLSTRIVWQVCTTFVEELFFGRPLIGSALSWDFDLILFCCYFILRCLVKVSSRSLLVPTWAVWMQ